MKWQPTPVFLPGKSHGQRSLEGSSPWGRKESDTTETHTQCIYGYVNSQIIIQFKVSLSFGKCQELRVYNAMATHSSTLAWKIPWAEEPGGLQSMGWLGVGHDRATSLSLFTFMRWRRKWQPTPVFFPGESQGPGSRVGCHLWGRTELDMTEAT